MKTVDTKGYEDDRICRVEVILTAASGILIGFFTGIDFGALSFFWPELPSKLAFFSIAEIFLLFVGSIACFSGSIAIFSAAGAHKSQFVYLLAMLPVLAALVSALAGLLTITIGRIIITFALYIERGVQL